MSERTLLERWRTRPVKRSIFWRTRRWLLLIALVAITALSATGLVMTRIELPEAEALRQTTFICAADVPDNCNEDNSLAQLSGGEDRVNVAFTDIPPILVQAVLAAEDRDFFEHTGIDLVGIGRAAYENIREGEVSQGGSTITQQYVKNVYLTNERTVERKIKEAALAIKIEREIPKEEILTRYLNTIYFGRGAYGVQAASKAYFGKDVQQLGLAEASYLAALIRAPESADAWRTADRASEAAVAERELAESRRLGVLEAMLAEGYITQQQLEEADAVAFEPPYLRPRETESNFGHVRAREFGTEYFVEHVRRWLRTEGGFTDAQIYGGGLRVYTTLDYGLQQAAYESVATTLDRTDDPSAALISIDEQGRVRAMMGGRNFATSQVNLATGSLGGGSGRQPGSSFKPVVLAEALSEGISVESVYPSPGRRIFPGANGGSDWSVSNYGGSEQGSLSLVSATTRSSNTVFAALMLEVGPENVVGLAEQLGIESDLPVVPALALGAGEVSVLDMASAFSTFAGNGVHIDPIVVTRVEDADGAVLYQAQPRRQRVLDEDVAATLNWVLRQVIDRGTGTAARLNQPAAGKTGTTQDNRDAWFVGYTCHITTAVWMGYVGAPGEPTRYMNSVHGRAVTGGSFPAEMWRTFMSRATEGHAPCSFNRPSELPGDLIAPTTVDGGTTTIGPTTTEGPAATTTTAPATTTPPTTTAPPTTSPATIPLPPTTIP
jgi:penicillin-binding protein 1A